MKPAVLTLAAAVAVVSATPNGGIPLGAKVACDKPNVNFCWDATTLVVCDANKVGTRSFCRESLDSFPPKSGVGLCWQSSRDAGDAVCHKACVVYNTKQYTIPAAQCNPTYIPTEVPKSDTYGTPTPTASTGSSTKTPSLGPSGTTESGVMSIPEGTSLGTATVPHTTTILHTTHNTPTATATATATATGKPGNSTLHTTTRAAIPTAGANTNHAIGVLVAAGFVAAFFF
ncbi:hypothetical protein NOR_05011 [Metarhizium rileyi]|uniref:Uncharacterized protein n=1 Tax=Metarhizium rileyi (strain RCEF 4871) TaxID=1649241 RepID=A0A167DBA1_METRR|nr:hypothetical protein NOR_05011 [Metarhizium rileyi RCEF 4871]TWU72535.1 hypothetical protein ED733_003908 [Metarhizium rileyi]